MKTIISTSALAALMAIGSYVMAQDRFMARGEGFQTAGAVHMEFGGPDDFRQVKGIPLSADIVNTHVQHLADGNTITNEETSHFYRDSEGRTRRENKLLLPGASSANAPTMIMINDPVAHTRFVLHTEGKSADKIPGGPAGENAIYVSRRVAGENTGVTKSSRSQNDEQREDLGTQTINGFAAHGTRTSHVIPAGQIGNAKPITVTTESWYSDDLGMEMLRVHNDPWSGEITTKVTNVHRGEQDASLFTPPADYKMNGPGQRVIQLQTKDGEPLPPPPPPPQD